MNKETKRKRGGQRGNQNARTHGFYSHALSDAELSEMWNLISRQGIEPQFALLEIKLRACLEKNPGNERVLRDATKLVTRWQAARLGLKRAEDRTFLRKGVRSLLKVLVEQKKKEREKGGW